MKKCQNSYLWCVHGGSIVGPSFLVQLTLKKLIQKKIHVIGTLRPQREMVDKTSSVLNEIQLRTQRLQIKLDKVYCAWLKRAFMPIYIEKSGDLGRWYRSLTHTQTTEYSATQLVLSIKFKLSQAKSHCCLWNVIEIHYLAKAITCPFGSPSKHYSPTTVQSPGP